MSEPSPKRTLRQQAEAQVYDFLHHASGHAGLAHVFPESEVASNDEVRRHDAARIVEVVFEVLRHPDWEMLEAGRREFQRAVPKPATDSYLRRFAMVVWRAMLHEVR